MPPQQVGNPFADGPGPVKGVRPGETALRKINLSRVFPHPSSAADGAAATIFACPSRVSLAPLDAQLLVCSRASTLEELPLVMLAGNHLEIEIGNQQFILIACRLGEDRPLGIHDVA